MPQVTKELRETVAADVREAATISESEMLRSPEYMQVWGDLLKSLKKDLELQHTRKRGNVNRAQASLEAGRMDYAEFLEVKAAADEWRASSGKLLVGVEKRIAEHKRLESELAGKEV